MSGNIDNIDNSDIDEKITELEKKESGITAEETPDKTEKSPKKEGVKEEQKPEKEPGVIAKNISKNKKVIIYYIGVLIVNIAVRATNLIPLLLPDSPIGGFINGIATDGVLFISFIAPWVFGGREALTVEQEKTKRVKEERTQTGKQLAWANILVEGLRTKNELQATLMEQNGMKPFRYTPPSDIGYGSEVKPE